MLPNREVKHKYLNPTNQSADQSDAAVIEVVLRNGRILRLSERVTPENAARVADALEAGGR